MRFRSDSGAATLAAIGVAAVLLVGIAVAAQLVRAVAASHRAAAAADLAALSAATAVTRLAAAPCDAAARTARSNGAELVSCGVSYPASGVQVAVGVRNLQRIWPQTAASAQARAGLREVPVSGAPAPAWPP